jgi:hypothetical protein
MKQRNMTSSNLFVSFPQNENLPQSHTGEEIGYDLTSQSERSWSEKLRVKNT